MLTNELLNKIERKEITSRRQLYLVVGRSQKLLQYLNDNSILMPKSWNKNKVISELKKLKNKLNRLPVASDNWTLTKQAQKYFKTWNNALFIIFNTLNQNRYGIKDRNEAEKIIRQFIKKYQRLPLRKEFDGNTWPYFETILNAYNCSTWKFVLETTDLSNLKILFNKKHGMGNIKVYKNILFLSHEEYLIGKYLLDNNINFEKEVKYCNCSNYVFDFYISKYNFYIEYYGLSHLDTYKRRIEQKRKHYHDNNVLEIFKHDNTVKKLADYIKVQRL